MGGSFPCLWSFGHNTYTKEAECQRIYSFPESFASVDNEYRSLQQALYHSGNFLFHFETHIVARKKGLVVSKDHVTDISRHEQEWRSSHMNYQIMTICKGRYFGQRQFTALNTRHLCPPSRAPQLGLLWFEISWIAEPRSILHARPSWKLCGLVAVSF